MALYRPKVYTASKLRHGVLWREKFAIMYPDIEFTARWLGFSEGPDHNTSFWSEDQKRLHWIQDIQDVQRSDFVLAYSEPEDDPALSGTIAECGAAISIGKVVFTVGFAPRHSWQAHPLVIPMESIYHALDYITGKL